MSTTIPALSSVTDILDTDLVMVTHSSGESFKIAGLEINKRNQAVIASSTTLTGAPLKTGNIVRAYFTADITGSNTSTGLTLNYNGVNYSVKVPKNGTLANFVASDLGGSPTVYKYLQAHTTLELLYDGTQFIIIGNPVVLSSANYTIYADGLQRVDSVSSGNKNMVTSDAVSTALGSKALFWGSLTNSFTNRKDIAEQIAIDYNNQVGYKTFVIYTGITNVGYFTGVISFTSNKNNYFAIVARRSSSGVIEHWNCDDGTFTLTAK